MRPESDRRLSQARQADRAQILVSVRRFIAALNNTPLGSYLEVYSLPTLIKVYN